jgi:hypothetical protein
MKAWLGHENLCTSQSGLLCNCPCPTCGEPLDVFAPDGCKQPEHDTGDQRPPVREAAKCAACGDPIRPAGDGWTHHPYNYATACEKAIRDIPEPRYLTTLSDGDGDLG